MINQGRMEDAIGMCRAAVESNPRDVNMMALLGATLVKARHHEEAEKSLREAIRLAPNFAKPHEDLGRLLLALGRAKEAAETLENAVRLDPELEEAWFTLGKARAALGEGKRADEAFEQSFELNPVRKKLALAAEHQKEGRKKQAENMYRDVLREQPDNVDALRMLGNISMGAGRIYEAERLFRRATTYAPDFVQAVVDLGRALKEQGRLEEAIETFRRAIELEPNAVGAHFLLASALSTGAQTYEAVESYKNVLELRPRHSGAKLGLGHVLKTVGRQQDAIDAYRDCIRLRPDQGEVYWSLANLKTYQLSDEDIREMESRIENSDLTEQSRVNFLFALAKAWEDRNDYERAWRYYAEGNSRNRLLENYDPVRTEVMNDEVVEVFDHQLLERCAGAGHPAPDPIFVVGLPRSGSTLIEQILASHSMVEGTSELPYIGKVATSLNRNRADGVNYPHAIRELGSEHFKALGEDYLQMARIHRTLGRPRFIDKMPNNFPTVGFMRLILPNAKIIDARRYPLDSCVSCYRQLFAQGQSFTYDLTDIGEYFLQYQRMMDYWHEALPGQVLTVQYEEVVTDFENQVRRMLEFCELPFEDNCLKFFETDRPVRTASSEQVRQPIHTRAVHHWRNYEAHLGELIEVLEEVLPRYARYETINR